MTDIPHFSLPFRWVNSTIGMVAAVTEQDSDDEIKDCIEAIVRYEKGQRPEAPDFGVLPQAFKSPIVKEDIAVALQLNEPRATEIITTDIDTFDALITNVRISIEDNESRSTTGGANA